ncbi:hypothetical protein PLICRDRAFT_605808 [Plicaturopsis crispa FD-325 SS-3]|nr:hypothetical protein PLICRDRAFT_605808 [Plicaturopsis crispa FD-325 SS-3]
MPPPIFGLLECFHRPEEGPYSGNLVQTWHSLSTSRQISHWFLPRRARLLVASMSRGRIRISYSVMCISECVPIWTPSLSLRNEHHSILLRARLELSMATCAMHLLRPEMNASYAHAGRPCREQRRRGIGVKGCLYYYYEWVKQTQRATG